MKKDVFVSKWNDFWFKEQPVEGIAIFRILFGCVLLLSFTQDALIMNEFWGPDAIQSVTTGMKNYFNPTFNLFQYFEMSYSLLYTAVTIQFISIICFIIGFKTRLASILTFVLLVSFQQRTINMLSSADLLMRIMSLLMIFAPAGNAFSVDSILGKLKGIPLKKDYSVWVHRLIQIQIAVVYISTVIAKSKGETWLDGSAVYYSTRLVDLTRFPVPFILDWKWTIMLSTWGSLITEISLGTLIFIDEFRKPLIFWGILFHLGIEYMMSIPTFEWLMIACLLAMFNFSDYRLFSQNIKSKLLQKLKTSNIKESSKHSIQKVLS
jgi:uncharacterized membrane protein YphA (DoxX/SURF4 family)